jgi:signal transduction histidine kinase/CheY-like chemotaxis protein
MPAATHLDERLLEGQNRLLEMVAGGESLDDILSAINTLIEAQLAGAWSSVLLVDQDRLRPCFSASLPAEFVAACDGVPIGPGVGTCGNAAYTGMLTITEDIATDPCWEPYRPLALRHGLRSCWSKPIRAPDRTLLGTFAIYTPRPSTPTPEHLRVIDVAAHLAGLAIARDRAQRTLEERASALAEADRRKDVFLATLAHELRNPLAPIMTAVELMHRCADDPAQVARARDVVDRHARQLVHLVDDLLDVSRITQGKIRLSRARSDIARVVESALENVAPMIDARGHAITIERPPAPATVDGDFSRLVQVMSNLLGNAAKYTPYGGRITVAWRVEHEEVVIEVRDTGVGIRPDLLPRVFDLFVQADRTLDRAQGGLGVGLTLVRSIVELHGGRVTAASPGPGEGSVFTVRLPTCAVARPLVEGAASAPRARRVAPGVRVLVVDDNVDAAALLAMALEDAGYEVRTAGEGLSALRMAAQWDPHALLLDIGLPELDGYAVARELRRRSARPDVRLVAITGYGQDSDRARAAESGFDALLVKPASLEAVFDALVGLCADTADLASS